eukprot:426896-Pelagomonas_calceolata.AAC.2
MGVALIQGLLGYGMKWAHGISRKRAPAKSTSTTWACKAGVAQRGHFQQMCAVVIKASHDPAVSNPATWACTLGGIKAGPHMIISSSPAMGTSTC